MRTFRFAAAPVLLALFCAFVAIPATAEEEAGLAVGDAAPDFSLTGSDGETYTLGQFKDSKNVALAFFPMAFTPG